MGLSPPSCGRGGVRVDSKGPTERWADSWGGWECPGGVMGTPGSMEVPWGWSWGGL